MRDIMKPRNIATDSLSRFADESLRVGGKVSIHHIRSDRREGVPDKVGEFWV
jgi:hypothetical protein